MGWKLPEALREIEAIMASAGNVVARTQIAKAILRVIRMTEDNRIAPLERALVLANPHKLRKEREYDFPEMSWTQTQWDEKVTEMYEKTSETLTDIKEYCDASPNKAAQMIMEVLDSMETRNQEFFLVCALYDTSVGLCPMNFVEVGIRIDDIEQLEISTREHMLVLFEKLDRLFSGDERALTYVDEGAYLQEMLMKLSHKEAAVFLGKYAEFARRKHGFKVIGIRIANLGHSSECDCGNCVNSRAARGN